MDRSISNQGGDSSLNEEEDCLILPPENFSMVESGVYRSAFPRVKNQAFLLHIGIKTIIPLVPEDYPAAMKDFCARNGIQLVNSCGVDGNKWPFKEIDSEVLEKALYYIMHRSSLGITPGSGGDYGSCSGANMSELSCGSGGLLGSSIPYTYRPCLIHCNKGKHRTGSLVGMLRRLRGWGLSSTIQEYHNFAAPKPRLEDQRFIEAFDPYLFQQRHLMVLTATEAGGIGSGLGGVRSPEEVYNDNSTHKMTTVTTTLTGIAEEEEAEGEEIAIRE